MRCCLSTLLLALVLVPPAPGRGLEVAAGAPLWMAADRARRELPGEAGLARAGDEHTLLLEVLAGRHYQAAAAALGSFDLAGAARALAEAATGDPAALSPVEAWQVLASLGGALPSPAAGLPAERDAELYGRVRAGAEAAWGSRIGSGPASVEALKSFGADVARLAEDLAGEPWRPELLGAEVLGAPMVPPQAVADLLAGKGPERVQRAYVALAWARRACLELLGTRGLEPRARLLREVSRRRVRLEGAVRADGVESPEGLVVSLAGGRLGTTQTGRDGSFSLPVEFERLGRILGERPVLELGVVRDRKVVYQRSMAAGTLLAGFEAVGGDPTVRRLAVGQLQLPAATGTLEVRVPIWPRLLDGRVEGPKPSAGQVHLAGQGKLETLSKWGTGTFRNLRPGWRPLTMVGTDASGGIVYRAFSFAEVKAGEKVTLELDLPVGEAPTPRQQKSAWGVKKAMKEIADGYKAGHISLQSFRNAIGETYRLHRSVFGNEKKDREFAQEVALAMKDVLASVQPSAIRGGDLSPRLDSIEEELRDLRTILPDSLQKENPAGRLQVRVNELVERLFSETVSGEFRSGTHLDRALREGREDIEELVGLTVLLEDALAKRLAELGAAFRAVAADYQRSYVLFHGGGFDYEDRFLTLASSRFLPLEELLEQGRQLTRERVVEDLRARRGDEEARLAARRARLAARGAGLERLATAARTLIEAWEARRREAEGLWSSMSGTRQETLQRWLGVQAGAGDQALRVFQGLPDPPHQPWPAGAAAVPDLAAPLGTAEAARQPAWEAKQAYEDEVKRDLDLIYELEADEKAMEELMALAPTARRKELNARLSGLFLAKRLPEPGSPSWPPDLHRRTLEISRAVLVAYQQRDGAVRDFVRARRQELEQVSAQVDPDHPASLAAAARALEAWTTRVREQAPAAPLHPEVVPDGLRLQARALEARLEKLVAGLGATSLSEPDRDYLTRRGWLRDSEVTGGGAGQTPPAGAEASAGP